MRRNAADWKWVETTAKASDVSEANIRQVYSFDKEPHPPGTCRGCNNSACLNGLGQTKWDRKDAFELYCKTHKAFIPDASQVVRTAGAPAGLRNLGATCYMNSLLQVLYANDVFRRAVLGYDPDAAQGQQATSQPFVELKQLFRLMKSGKQPFLETTGLVTALDLPTGEQQDVVEFAKLFLQLTEIEFGRHPDRGARNLVNDLFTGHLDFVTVCSVCHNESRQSAPFWDLALSISAKTLPEIFAAYVRPEDLDGDNQYLCSKCDVKRNAHRYADIRSLPPVLMLQLSRFVYDPKKMQKQKVSQKVSIPLRLKGDDIPCSNAGDYELMAVITHSGPSAYGGHYIAFTRKGHNKNWYRLDDEHVVNLGPKLNLTAGAAAAAAKEGSASSSSSASANKGKRKARSSDAEDDEEDELTVSSGEAYVLIYVARDHVNEWAHNNKGTEVVDPEIAQLNEQIEAKLKENEQVRTEWTNKFEKDRQLRLDVADRWTLVDADEFCHLFSTAELEGWLSLVPREEAKSEEAALAQAIEASCANNNEEETALAKAIEASKSDDAMDGVTAVVGVDDATENANKPSADGPAKKPSSKIELCPHSNLDISSKGDIKRVNEAAAEILYQEGVGSGRPRLTSNSLCVECVQAGFKLRKSTKGHQENVATFKKLLTKKARNAETDLTVDDDNADIEPTCWVSRSALADWTKADGGPLLDIKNYLTGDIICEHNKLCADTTLRQEINTQAYIFLENLAGGNQTKFVTASFPVCAVCKKEHNKLNEQRKVLKKGAQSEKNELKRLLDKEPLILETEPVGALLPKSFVNRWRAQLMDKLTQPDIDMEPLALRENDTKDVVCADHQKLTSDPNKVRQDAWRVEPVTDEELKALNKLYGPLPEWRFFYDSLAKTLQTNPEVCPQCTAAQGDFESARVFVQVLLPTESLPDQSFVPAAPAAPLPTSTAPGDAPRRSKRQRKNNVHELVVYRQQSIHFLKLQLVELTGKDPFLLRLYLDGHELVDDSLTMLAVGVKPDCTFYLRIDAEPPKSAKAEKAFIEDSARVNEAERGFRGTLLSGGGAGGSVKRDDAPSSPVSSPPQPQPQPQPPVIAQPKNEQWPCVTCTFLNDSDLAACTMCATPRG